MCLGGCYRSTRTAVGRLRGIALSDQNRVGILPRPVPSEGAGGLGPVSPRGPQANSRPAGSRPAVNAPGPPGEAGDAEDVLAEDALTP